jgi:alkanesulfonate monooxygenase SsuD/methylene tetrahydromethanopterin reductase-like flavin-dependent oxidoreductase (luciferase family)
LMQVREVASQAGRDPKAIAAAIYLTLRIDDDSKAADRHINDYLSSYYGAPAEQIRKSQANFAGSEAGAIDWLQGFIDAGAEHIMIRLAGDHERQMESVVRIREALVSTGSA